MRGRVPRAGRGRPAAGARPEPALLFDVGAGASSCAQIGQFETKRLWRQNVGMSGQPSLGGDRRQSANAPVSRWNRALCRRSDRRYRTRLRTRRGTGPARRLETSAMTSEPPRPSETPRAREDEPLRLPEELRRASRTLAPLLEHTSTCVHVTDLEGATCSSTCDGAQARPRERGTPGSREARALADGRPAWVHHGLRVGGHARWLRSGRAPVLAESAARPVAANHRKCTPSSSSHERVLVFF